MYLTATSSLVFLSLTSLATPKFPEPRSFNGSYRSSIRTPIKNPQNKKTKMKNEIETEEKLGKNQVKLGIYWRRWEMGLLNVKQGFNGGKWSSKRREILVRFRPPQRNPPFLWTCSNWWLIFNGQILRPQNFVLHPQNGMFTFNFQIQ